MDGFVKSVSVLRIRQQSEALLDLVAQRIELHEPHPTSADAAASAADTSSVELEDSDDDSSGSEPVAAARRPLHIGKRVRATASSAEADAATILEEWEELPVDEVSVRDSGALQAVEALMAMTRLPLALASQCERLLQAWGGLRADDDAL